MRVELEDGSIAEVSLGDVRAVLPNGNKVATEQGLGTVVGYKDVRIMQRNRVYRLLTIIVIL